jgi:hypothetical protein
MKKYLMINSESMGQGDFELGKTVLKMFLDQVAQNEVAPEGIAFLNSGVKLACTGSPVLEALKALEAKGTKISSCITCLKFYDLLDSVEVGIQGTMPLYVEYMMDADDTFVI